MTSPSGPGDTGPGDTGPVDTGPVDTGPGDTGPVDTGPVDTGPGSGSGDPGPGPAEAGATEGVAPDDAVTDGASPDEAAPEGEVLDLDDELAAMTAGESVAPALADALRQRDEYLDALRHLQADFENFKKRSARQQADATGRGAEALVDKLLPALDTADLAVSHGGGEEVQQVWTALLDVLSREGLERIAPDGGPFDPNRHDAVMHEPGDGSEQAVAEVLRAGYAWKGKVLRPAMVKVRG